MTFFFLLRFCFDFLQEFFPATYSHVLLSPHVLVFPCLHIFLVSLSPYVLLLSCPHTRSLVLSSLHVLMFSCLHMFFLCSYCNHGLLLVIVTSLYSIYESLNHGFLYCFSNLRIFFYYSNPPLVLKISKVLKPGFLTDFIFYNAKKNI